MSDVDLKTLQRWHEDHAKQQKRRTNIDHFIALLGVMKMEQDIYASTTKFYERMQQLIADFEIVADNELREGNPLLKCLIIGLKSSQGSYITAAQSLHDEANKLATFFEKKAEG